MIHTTALIWGLCSVCLINAIRYYSSLRVLLFILRDCDPLLYQYVDGPGFFTFHGQLGKQFRLIRYIFLQHYQIHYDDEFIARCQRIRAQFMLFLALNFILFLAMLYLLY